jgi:predicted  nucleic acid-binding Zn-ribbon protein
VQVPALARLLDLQEQDSAIKLLRHRRETLPEAQRLRELTEQLAELGADIEIARKQCDEVLTQQRRIEGDISLLEDKIRKEEQRLFSGSVANPRELSSLQAEVEMNRRKHAQLEDDLLEVMVRRDQFDETLRRLESEHEGNSRSAAELGQITRTLTGDIDADLARHEQERARIAADIPGDLFDLYEGIRAQRNGVGAAALRDGTCQGCHTKLPAVEVERMKREGGLQRCDNCRRILVTGV